MNFPRLKNKELNIFLIGCILGFLAFLYLIGIEALDVTNDGWLLAEGGDLTQHYVGWLFYRESPVTFPLGLIENLVYPNRISVIFMDSIPLFAITFRLFESLLPETFQYFGIWILSCFLLQGGISAMIIKKITNNTFAAIAGCIFFIFSTVMLHNLLIQDSLSAHWLILAAFALWAYRDKLTFKLKIFLYSALAGMCILIHTYFIVMIGGICFFILLEELLSKKYNLNIKQFLTIIFSMLLVTTAVVFICGGFGNGEMINIEGELWNGFSAPLNTFIWPNSQMGGSYILKNYSDIDFFEGYGYLGLGAIILFMIAFMQIVKNKKINIYILIGSIIFFLMATMFKLRYNNEIIMIVDLLENNKLIKNFCSIFRANGRFIWPAFYIIILSSIFYIYKFMRVKNANIILILCLIIQFVDLTNINNYIKSFNFNRQYVSQLDSESWNELAEISDEIIVPEIKNSFSFVFEIYAIKNGLSINNTYAARANVNEIKKYFNENVQEILKGNPRDNVIYILERDKELPSVLNIYELNGYLVGTTATLKRAESDEKYQLFLNYFDFDKCINEGDKIQYISYYDTVSYSINKPYQSNISEFLNEENIIKENEKLNLLEHLLKGNIDENVLYVFDIKNELILNELEKYLDIFYVDSMCVGIADNLYDDTGIASVDSGWSTFEEEGIWTIGNKSTVVFDLDNLKSNMELELDIISKMDDVKLELTVNGNVVCNMIPQTGKNIVSIDETFLNIGKNEIAFNIEGFKHPNEEDKRELGIMVKNIKIR